MKRRFKVTIDGETFEVEVEETTEEAQATPRAASRASLSPVRRQ